MSKTLLVLGAGPGIGLATAQRFAREGHRVVLAARNPQRLEALAAELRETAPSAQIDTAPLDINDLDALNALVERHADQLDVLFYNAAVLPPDGAPTLAKGLSATIASFDNDIRVDITGALVAIRAALPAMFARRGGTILLTGGGLAMQPNADLLTLSVGKAGIRSIAQALFEPLKQQGVHIATVTVCKFVGHGSADAAAIAEQFWELHGEPTAAWRWEALYE